MFEPKVKPIYTKADFPILIEEFKLRLESDPELSLSVFSREKGLDGRQLQKWVTNRNMSVADMRTQAKIKLRIIDEPEGRHGDLYSFLLDEFRKSICNDPSMTLSKFCRQEGTSSTKFLKWLNRQGLTAADVKEEALGKLDAEDITETTILKLSHTAILRFKKILSDYKKQLRVNIKTTLKDYCAQHSVNLIIFRKWLDTLGTSEQILKKEARVLGKMVGGEAGSVFVQFRPNGMSNGDALRGVKIFFPNGGRVYVERCTVVSLCNLIHSYDAQQRRNKREEESL